MNISRVDLNLLVYLDVLLTETSVSKAAAKLGITQPAMSNGLKRLRDLFGDPLLVRTGGGMQPTERALSLRPALREAILLLEKTVQPQNEFDAANSDRVFRIMASDYGEATLLPSILDKMANRAPNICLDVLTPSDVGIEDLEQGKVDMAINRFDQMPNSFHQTTIWHDNFSCILHKDNPLVDDFTLDNYMSERHIWVSKTGMGRGVGINPGQSMRLGRLDEALNDLDLHRNIAVFTRHYQVAILLARQPHLVATVPTRLAKTLEGDSSLVIKKLPFSIAPFELKMIWSPLLHHNPEHIWLRRLVQECADELK